MMGIPFHFYNGISYIGKMKHDMFIMKQDPA